MFRGIEASGLKPLLPCLSAKRAPYEKGRTAFFSGEVIDRFGIALSGQVPVVQDDYFGNRGILAKTGTGNLFGESSACAENKPLPVSVVTTADSELLVMSCRGLAAPRPKAYGYHSRLIQDVLNILSMKNIALMQEIEPARACPLPDFESSTALSA